MIAEQMVKKQVIISRSKSSAISSSEMSVSVSVVSLMLRMGVGSPNFAVALPRFSSESPYFMDKFSFDFEFPA